MRWIVCRFGFRSWRRCCRSVHRFHRRDCSSTAQWNEDDASDWVAGETGRAYAEEGRYETSDVGCKCEDLFFVLASLAFLQGWIATRKHGDVFGIEQVTTAVQTTAAKSEAVTSAVSGNAVQQVGLSKREACRRYRNVLLDDMDLRCGLM